MLNCYALYGIVFHSNALYIALHCIVSIHLAIRYLEGGNESGFNEVQTNAGAEKRLLKLSGCDNMRIEEVSIGHQTQDPAEH